MITTFPREKIVDGNHDYFLKSEPVLFRDNIMNYQMKAKIVTKPHH